MWRRKRTERAVRKHLTIRLPALLAWCLGCAPPPTGQLVQVLDGDLLVRAGGVLLRGPELEWQELVATVDGQVARLRVAAVAPPSAP